MAERQKKATPETAKLSKEHARFVKDQRRSRRWISFAEIAEWCARKDSEIQPKEEARALALAKLGADLVSGEFDDGAGRPKVRFSHPEVSLEITRDLVRDLIEYDYDGARGRISYLPYCWIPRASCEDWLARHRFPNLPNLPPRSLADSSSSRFPFAKSAGGRPPEYNWLGVKRMLADWEASNGAIESRGELITKAGEFAADLHPKKRRPDDSTIRSAITKYKLP